MFGRRRRFRIRGRRGGRRSRSSAGARFLNKIIMIDDSEALTANASTGFTLCTADDDPLDNTITDFNGANITELESGSRIKLIDIIGTVQHASVGTRILVTLLKAPDGTAPAATTQANFMSMSENQDERDYRRNILWRRDIVIPSDKLTGRFRIKLTMRNNALRRLGKMNDNDSLLLRFFNTASTDGALVQCFGKIVSRK